MLSAVFVLFVPGVILAAVCSVNAGVRATIEMKGGPRLVANWAEAEGFKFTLPVPLASHTM